MTDLQTDILLVVKQIEAGRTPDMTKLVQVSLSSSVVNSRDEFQRAHTVMLDF
jgi:hypothetical protein